MTIANTTQLAGLVILLTTFTDGKLACRKWYVDGLLEARDLELEDVGVLLQGVFWVVVCLMICSLWHIDLICLGVLNIAELDA